MKAALVHSAGLDFDSASTGIPVISRFADATPKFFQSVADDGIEVVILLEAGALLDDPKPGDSSFFLVRDQIALFDVHVDEPPESGVRFTDMTEPFNAGLRAMAKRVFESQKVFIREMTVAGVRETGLLTEAECRALKSLGAEGVCESLPRATRRARAEGLPVLGILTMGEPDVSLLARVFRDIGQTPCVEIE